jgi:WD40 repeat protein
VLTVGFDRFACIWDRATGAQIHKFEIKDDSLLDGDFSPTGGEIILACANGQAFLLDATSGQTLDVLSGHEGQVRRARYFQFAAPDGAKRTGLMTAGYDGTVRLWQQSAVTKHWEQTTLLTGSDGPAYAVACSVDGCQIATGSADRAARLYYRDGSWLLKLAASRITRQLTPGEKIKYGIGD